jgi:hypothetical protein
VSLAVIAFVALGVVAPTTALAQSPSAYRAQLNGHCRTFTPRFKQVEANLKRAVRTRDPKLLASALGQGLALNLKQDAYIERVPVPAALHAQMTPILRLLRTVDRHARLALLDANAQNLHAFMTEVKAIDRALPVLNGRLDRAGLRDCGSGQA